MSDPALNFTPVATLGNPDLIDAMTAASRIESASVAQRFAAIAELFERRKREASTEKDWWIQDTWDATCCEIGAALGISAGRASGQLRYAEALRNRLPKLAEVFATGAIDLRIVAAVVYRTELVEDPELLAQVDAAVAGRASKWTKLSRQKVSDLVDSWVAHFDPAGVRVPSEKDQGRFIEISPDCDGMATIWGALRSPDTALVDQRLDQLAESVCPGDPRTKQQRRADALRALAGQEQTLGCLCGLSDCPSVEAKPRGDVVIHILTTVDPNTAAPVAGYIPGYGFIPPRLMPELAKTAKVRTVAVPPEDSAAECNYRPSAGLSKFIRLRDMTCRFPGCDHPAELADLDHTTPYPHGLTHPSNLKALCRRHHLLKTFSTGANGWRDEQLPDGTIIWTAPTGHTYTTKPGGSLLFPALSTPTGKLSPPPDLELAANREAKAPTRKRTRAQDRAQRIKAERKINQERFAGDPPPF